MAEKNKYELVEGSKLPIISNLNKATFLGYENKNGVLESGRIDFASLTPLFSVTQEKGQSITLVPSQKTFTDESEKKADKSIFPLDTDYHKNKSITPDKLSESTMQLIEASGGGTITNFPDEEDLTVIANELKFNNRAYVPNSFSGLGKVILRKNIVSEKNVLISSMIDKPNTAYEIRYDYDLDGAEITIPEGCILDFQGGSFSNGVIVGNNTIIQAGNYRIFSNVILSGLYATSFIPQWFGVKEQVAEDESVIDPDIEFIDNQEALQEMFDSVPDHSTIEVQTSLGDIYTSGTVFIDKFNIKVRAKQRTSYLPTFKGNGTYPIFHVRNSGFSAENIGFNGYDANNTSGTLNNSTVGIVFDREDGLPDIDCKLSSCLFANLKQAVEITGRNANIFDCDFSNNINGIKVNRKGTHDCRGFNISRNRFHSNGFGERPLPDGDESWCIEFTSPYAFGNITANNFVDGKSRGFYKGGLDRSHIANNLGILMYGTPFYIIDDENIFWSAWSLDNNVFSGISGTIPDWSMEYGIFAQGRAQSGIISNNVFSNIRKNGIELTFAFACNIHDNHITNPNRAFATDGILYDGIRIIAGSSNRVSGNFVRSTSANSFRYGIYNNSTGSHFSFNYVFNYATGKFLDVNPITSRVQNDPEPNYMQTYLQDSTLNLETGYDMYSMNAAGLKKLAGSLRAKTRNNVDGAENTDIIINAIHNGTLRTLMKAIHDGAITVGERTGYELSQNGVVNARVAYLDMVRYIAVAASNASSLSSFVDSENNALKFRDINSVVRSFAFEDVIAVATDANYNASGATLVKLPEITTNRSIALSTINGQIVRIKFWNQNTSTNSWIFPSSVKDLNGNAVTNLTNGKLYTLFKDGADWIVESVN